MSSHTSQATSSLTTLHTLLERLPEGWALAAPETPLSEAALSAAIPAITDDSRQVTPGALFVAYRGRKTDSHRYLAQAAQAGACAVAGERPRAELPTPLPETVPYWQVKDGRLAFALLSAAYYEFPSRKMIVVGVTGTDGKTTTSTLTHSVLRAHGLQTGLISTIAAQVGGDELDTGFHVTTPEAFALQGFLAQMAANGSQAVVLETTSHALDQKRVAWVDYDVAAVTNVTHEHLDWHGTWENYMNAKADLFRALRISAHKPGVAKSAIMNRDDASYRYLEPIWAEQKLTYSLRADAQATISARDITSGRDGMRFTLVSPAGEAPVRLNLFGSYNVANALAATGVGLALGVPLPTIVKGLEAVRRIKGRMELVYQGDFDVFVDFAHTPNALRETIRLAHTLVRPGGRVIVVFGSAGLRDVEKRALMGQEAVAADFSVITAEDPRTENVNDIIEEIVSGLREKGAREGDDFVREPDRAEAIATAVRLARPNDLIVTCGKAHETSMCYGEVETPWDEFAAVRSALARRGLSVD